MNKLWTECILSIFNILKFSKNVFETTGNDTLVIMLNILDRKHKCILKMNRWKTVIEILDFFFTLFWVLFKIQYTLEVCFKLHVNILWIFTLKIKDKIYKCILKMYRWNRVVENMNWMYFEYFYAKYSKNSILNNRWYIGILYSKIINIRYKCILKMYQI